MKHASLFSGIGGFDLAAEWMGWKNVFHCEWNEFGLRVLKYYWPDAISYDDIKQTDFTIHRGSIDILTGGFPCQPYSIAGKRKGKGDERHLWPEMLRAIQEIKPTWVVGENVRGLVNWNGGLVFDEVQADLEAEGYEVQPFLLPACGVEAPHQRDRIWFVAYSGDNGHKHKLGENRLPEEKAKKATHRKKRNNKNRERIWSDTERTSVKGTSSYPYGKGLPVRVQSREREVRGTNESFQGSEFTRTLTTRIDWGEFPTQHPVCNGNDGFSSELDGITFSKWRKESIAGAGNAIVPQAVIPIFKAIESYELSQNL